MEVPSCKPFWEDLGRYGSAIAIVDGLSSRTWTYRDLGAEVYDIADQLASPTKKLLFIPLNNNVKDIILYLSVLVSGHVPYLYSAHTSAVGLEKLIDQYKPDAIFGSAHSLVRDRPYKIVSDDKVYAMRMHDGRDGLVLNSLLTLLLSTSGSSGSSKLVRLSASNLQTNAMQICEALSIASEHRAVTSVPLSYIYGLSVLHSHLNAGATTIVDARTVMEKGFWKTMREQRITTFSGVPWSFRMLKAVGLEHLTFPSLVNFTTSGAKMDESTLDWIETGLCDARIYYMYGQTEAAGRISVLQPELAHEKKGSVGRAVRRGTLECADDGTVMYSGPNVMLGYAASIEDLGAADRLGGILDTGDLGHLDSDGCLFLTGRKSRICKVYGIRVSLDEVQDYFREGGLEIVAVENPTGTITVRYSDAAYKVVQIRARDLGRHLGVPQSAIFLENVSELPRLANGKLALQA